MIYLEAFETLRVKHFDGLLELSEAEEKRVKKLEKAQAEAEKLESKIRQLENNGYKHRENVTKHNNDIKTEFFEYARTLPVAEAASLINMVLNEHDSEYEQRRLEQYFASIAHLNEYDTVPAAPLDLTRGRFQLLTKPKLALRPDTSQGSYEHLKLGVDYSAFGIEFMQRTYEPIKRQSPASPVSLPVVYAEVPSTDDFTSSYEKQIGLVTDRDFVLRSLVAARANNKSISGANTDILETFMFGFEPEECGIEVTGDEKRELITRTRSEVVAHFGASIINALQERRLADTHGMVAGNAISHAIWSPYNRSMAFALPTVHAAVGLNIDNFTGEVSEFFDAEQAKNEKKLSTDFAKSVIEQVAKNIFTVPSRSV